MTPTETLIAEGQLAFSVVLALVTVWYAYETARLRKLSERQARAMESSINLTKASFDATLLPYLILGILPLSEDVSNRLVKQPTTSYINLPAFGQKAGALQQDRTMLFSVINATEKLASHIFMLYFDHNHSIFISCMVAESIGPKEELLLPMSRNTVPLDDVKHIISKIYEKRGEYLLNAKGIKLPDGQAVSIIDRYAESGDRHLLTIFFDLAGKLYAIPRLVFEEQDDSGQIVLTFGKSDLIQNAATFFAPEFESAVALQQ